RRGVPILVAAAPRLAVARAVLALEAEVEQRGQPLVGLEDDVAAVAAIAARGAAARHELLAPKRYRAGTAVAGFDENFRLIDELHGLGAGLRLFRFRRFDVHVDAVAAALLVLHGALDHSVQ